MISWWNRRGDHPYIAIDELYTSYISSKMEISYMVKSGYKMVVFFLSTSAVNPCVLSILIATLLQHLKDLNKKRLPDFKGGISELRQQALILGSFA